MSETAAIEVKPNEDGIKSSVIDLKTKIAAVLSAHNISQTYVSLETGLNANFLSMFLGVSNKIVPGTPKDLLVANAKKIFDSTEKYITDPEQSKALQENLKQLAEKTAELRTALNSEKISWQQKARQQKPTRPARTSPLSERATHRRAVREAIHDGQTEEVQKPKARTFNGHEAELHSGHVVDYALQQMREYKSGTSTAPISQHIEATRAGIASMFTSKNPWINYVTLGKAISYSEGAAFARQAFLERGIPPQIDKAKNVINEFATTFLARPPYDQPKLDANFKELCSHLSNLFDKARSSLISGRG